MAMSFQTEAKQAVWHDKKTHTSRGGGLV